MDVAAPAATYASPVSEETDAIDLPVAGVLPPGLSGDYIRNGPNPRPGAKAGHLFLGDGMLHGIRIENGAAKAYRNRWVRTRAFVEQAPYVSKLGKVDLTVGVANTNVVAHGGKLLALVESSFPMDVTRELATDGVDDFNARLKTPFTAHPKICPRTGEMHAFGMAMLTGALTYHRVAADGTLTESRPIPVKGATMMHDFALTATRAIFMDLPVVFDMFSAMRGSMPYKWNAKYGARLGIVSREDASVPVRWIDIEPCYVFHVANAYDDGASIVLDVVHYKELWANGNDTFDPTSLRRWTIDTRRGSVSETVVDATPVEFPRIDERRTGTPHRFVYSIGVGATGHGRSEVRKTDVVTGSTIAYDFGADRRPGEAVFVPAGEAEDAGWVMCYVYDATRDRSDYVVLDARDIAAGPVATVALPVRVPLGFHGNWIDAAETVR